VLKSEALKAWPIPSLAEAVLKIWRSAIDKLGLPSRPPASSTDLEWLYLRARAHARVGDLDEAARRFAVVIERAPTFADAFEDYAELLDRMGQHAQARSHYDIVQKLRQEPRPPQDDRCFVLRHRRNAVADIPAYTAALRSGSSKRRALTYVARGNSYLSTGRAKLALLDYAQALKLAPRPEVIALKAEALSRLGRHEEAVAAFDAAVASRPDDAEIRSGRAHARLALGRLGDADDDWRRQLALLPTERALARACVHLRLAQYQAALPDLQGAIEKEPGNPYWRLYQAAALCRLGRPSDPQMPDGPSWPAPLIALHAGKASADSVLDQADSPARRAEAMFQIGVVAYARAHAQDRAEARRWWEKVASTAAPATIEHAAARHELAHPAF
jgi:tetratricopeptide (TPR) repeat protein